MSTSIINGLIVTITDDMGPKPLINIGNDQINEILAYKIAMIGMTVLMLGNSDPVYFTKRHNKILGPLPIPFDNQTAMLEGKEIDMVEAEAVALIFNVKVDLPTEDQRAIEFGREAIVWFVFNSSDRDKIFSITKKIEETAKVYLENIQFESQLTDKERFKGLFDEILNVTSEIDLSQPSESHIPEPIKYANYSLYKFDFDKEKLLPVLSFEEVKKLELLIIVDLKDKQINLLQFQPKVPERKLFMVSKAIANLNLSLKREFTVRNVTDQFEIMMYMEKIEDSM